MDVGRREPRRHLTDSRSGKWQWVPLGKLNDVAAVRRQDSLAQLVWVTLIQSAPFTVGLLFSLKYFGRPVSALAISVAMH